MTPGGSFNCRDCDDCAYQDCLVLGVCLGVQARLMDLDPSDLVQAGPVWVGLDCGGPDYSVSELVFQRLLPKLPEQLEEYQRLCLVSFGMVIRSELVDATQNDDQAIPSEGARRE